MLINSACRSLAHPAATFAPVILHALGVVPAVGCAAQAAKAEGSELTGSEELVLGMHELEGVVPGTFKRLQAMADLLELPDQIEQQQLLCQVRMMQVAMACHYNLIVTSAWQQQVTAALC